MHVSKMVATSTGKTGMVAIYGALLLFPTWMQTLCCGVCVKLTCVYLLLYVEQHILFDINSTSVGRCEHLIFSGQDNDDPIYHHSLRTHAQSPITQSICRGGLIWFIETVS
jgi:hypothetical protein